MLESKTELKEFLGVDLRSLALFRICLALIILADLITRLSDLEAFYTDFGLLPRAVLISKHPGLISLHLMGGTAAFQAILFLIQGSCAASLLIGWRTRLMTFLSWFLMASLHSRNHLVIGGGDDYLRILLFWCLFVPLGERFSVDSALNGPVEKQPSLLCSWGTIALLVQNISVYWVAAVLKLREPVWIQGNAIYYALSIFNYAKDFADFLLRFPGFLKVLTYAVLSFEIVGPLLLFFPVRTGPVRTAVVFLFFYFHLGFYSCLYLKNFPWVSMAAMLVFLPSWFWEQSKGLLHFLERCIGPYSKKLLHAASGFTWRPAAFTPSVFSESCAIFFLVCVLFWNVAGLYKYPVPGPIGLVCRTFSIDQQWRMFVPPVKHSGWFVIPGRLKDGTESDLFHDGLAVSWKKPSKELAFKNERWRRYTMNFIYGKNKAFWPSYARYLCRSWNASHHGSKKLESLQIVMMEKTTSLEGGPQDYQKRVLLRQECSQFEIPPQRRKIPKRPGLAPHAAAPDPAWGEPIKG